MSLLGTINHSLDGHRSNRNSVHSPWHAEASQNDPNQITEDSMETSSLSSEDENKGKRDVIERRISNIAKRFSRSSTPGSDGLGINPYDDVPKDSPLNPNGPNFNARTYIKNLLAVQSRDPDRYPHRTAGLAFKNLGVHGFGSPTDYQKDVFNSVLSIGGLGRGKKKIQILQGFDGLIESGDMLVVLGRPGSGCTTFLKTISGETNGTFVEPETELNYQGISAQQMHGQFRGEAIYTAEVDVHFPQLTVGQTLAFAARARAPENRLPGVSRDQYADHMKDVAMAMFGLNHTVNTKVGNDFIRGVSGGERKRVSIAEAALSQSPLQCWDNSTRGLDSANAIEFCKTLRTETDLTGVTACVAIYQAPQAAYDIFNKAIVLYEGRQIYFGPTTEAKKFFTDMGFVCPERQTDSDFLTSITSAEERIVREGFEDRVPRTPDEFAALWKASPERARLMEQIDDFESRYPIGGDSVKQFEESRRAMQSKGARRKSPYILSVPKQIGLCCRRGFDRLKGDATLTLTALFSNSISALIIGSVFYNLPDTTTSLQQRAVLLFFSVLLSAFASVLEILTLYAQRPIVEKHSRYALYHPFAEAVASMICDLPYKISNSILFSIIVYFLPNLRREPGAFFTFWLFSLATTFSMSMIFRTIGASSRTLAQALAPAALLMLGLMIFTGFVVPTRDMLGWSRWMNYIDPIAYAFESLMVNEFVGRQYECNNFVPYYETATGLERVCSSVGAQAGASTVDGTVFIAQSYDYLPSHLWRNLGIMLAFIVFFCGTYLVATEYITEAKSKGEVLLFRRGHAPKAIAKGTQDEEAGVEKPVGLKHIQSKQQEQAEGIIQKQTAIFQWKDVTYDIKIKSEERRILDHVDGWVKPGTCTALMGVSGAGKTTLLDVLATRVSMGVVGGEMLVDGRERDSSFQRKTGYVQQQDLHLETTTVREALQFSALLRQPAKVPRKEKLDYVEEVIKLLDMELYSDAVVGVPGEGLNVEQRKRLTIGVELVAKPELLLFLDEPTSGLDSQTSWSILNLLDTLTAHGQAILCTIHQPSAMLFQRFDRLLFLAKGGRTVYFGDIGEKSSILTSYFERNGASPCPPDANPAEWMLEVIGAAPGSHTDIDWPVVWRNSPEIEKVHEHLEELKNDLSQRETAANSHSDKSDYNEFAAPMVVQLWECGKRIFSQYWRSPSYIYSKSALCILTALFVGFVFFQAQNTQQGLMNQLFSIFMLLTMFGNMVQQIMPNFVTQRALYESRERPAKVYSWQAFMYVNIFVEVCWNSLMAVFLFVCWYYPIGMWRNAQPTDAVNERAGLMFVIIWFFMLFTSTFAIMVIAGVDLAETGGNITNLLFSLSLIFCGVLATPEQLPGFWIFMYRVSPFTYIVSSIMSTGLANTLVECSDIEFLTVQPPMGSNCGQYFEDQISTFGGYVLNNESTSNCQYCPVGDTNVFLTNLNIDYSERWRNVGIVAVYIVFNTFAALGIYWLARVPKKQRTKAKKE